MRIPRPLLRKFENNQKSVCGRLQFINIPISSLRCQLKNSSFRILFPISQDFWTHKHPRMIVLEDFQNNYELQTAAFNRLRLNKLIHFSHVLHFIQKPVIQYTVVINWIGSIWNAALDWNWLLCIIEISEKLPVSLVILSYSGLFFL